MPTNLNALLRYKTIDSCLRNKQVNCTIDLLIERCSHSLTEFTGTPRSVSERTIREDIKNLRSDTLGFNAPILFEDGRYFYEEDDYSAFGKSITEINLLISVQKLIIENYSKFNDKKNVSYLLGELSNITAIKVPEKYRLNQTEEEFKVFQKKFRITGKYVPNSKELFRGDLSSYLYKLRATNKKPLLRRIIDSLLGNKKPDKEIFNWEYIFRIVD